MNLERLSQPQRISAIAMLVVVLGSFLPWASVLGLSISGLRADGAITLLMALVGLAGLAFATGVFGKTFALGKVESIGQIVLSGIVLLIAVVDMSGFAAIGLYLVLLAGIAWLAAAVWQLVEENKASRTPEAE